MEDETLAWGVWDDFGTKLSKARDFSSQDITISQQFLTVSAMGLYFSADEHTMKG